MDVILVGPKYDPKLYMFKVKANKCNIGRSKITVNNLNFGRSKITDKTCKYGESKLQPKIVNLYG